ncbi:MAG: O-antigen ligase family protein [Nitrospirae bacterium]|nr:O-antigen ligase family protein [Candidatus Troglogloeales bacterium]
MAYRTIINLLVFLIPAAAITLPLSIGTGTALLFLTSLFAMATDRTLPALDAMEKRLLMTFGLFAAVAFFSVFWSGDPLSEFDTFSRFVLAIPIYLLLRRYPPAPEAFWIGAAVGAIGGGLLASYQKFILGIPFDGGHIHHIRFGDINLVLGGIAAAGLPYFRRFHRGYLVPIAALVFGIIGSILSGARGGWPAIPILLCCLYRQNFKSYQDVSNGTRIATLLIGFLVAFCFLYGGGSQRVTVAMSDVQQYQSGHKGTSVGLRFELWRASGRIFLDHPILGVGKTGFIAAIQNLASSKVIDPETVKLHSAHNDFLDILAKRGLAGLLSFLLIFIVPVRQFMRTLQQGSGLQKPFGMAGLILTLCFLTFSLTETQFILNLPTTFYIFTVVVLCASIVSAGKQVASPTGL